MQKLGITSLFKGDFRLKLFLEGTIIGVFVGILVVAFRIALQKAEQLREHIYVIITVQGTWGIITWFILLLLIGLLLAYIVRKVPMSGGSGIPQVKGVLQGQIKIANPFLLIIGKIIGVVLLVLEPVYL
jgi:H+/Cl- antiporter ClcA